MFTSDTKKELMHYLIASIVTCIFGIIYEQFSHNVYSPFMYLAFLIPLFGIIIKITLKIIFPNYNNLFSKLYDSSIMTFTIGSIIKGVIEIYGTTNHLITIYLIFGIILLFSALFTLIKR